MLKTKILRNTANQMAYCDKDTFATEDAVRVGQLHTRQPQWADATLSFMKSDGYKAGTQTSCPPCPLCFYVTPVDWQFPSVCGVDSISLKAIIDCQPRC